MYIYCTCLGGQIRADRHLRLLKTPSGRMYALKRTAESSVSLQHWGHSYVGVLTYIAALCPQHTYPSAKYGFILASDYEIGACM